MLEARTRRRVRQQRDLAVAIRAAHSDGDLRSLIADPPKTAPKRRGPFAGGRWWDDDLPAPTPTGDPRGEPER